MKKHMTRRSALGQLAGATAAVGALAVDRSEAQAGEASGPLKGRINHSVCKWCYDKIPLDEFCAAAKAMNCETSLSYAATVWSEALRFSRRYSRKERSCSLTGRPP